MRVIRYGGRGSRVSWVGVRRRDGTYMTYMTSELTPDLRPEPPWGARDDEIWTVELPDSRCVNAIQNGVSHHE